jgi:hypothetical protein
MDAQSFAADSDQTLHCDADLVPNPLGLQMQIRMRPSYAHILILVRNTGFLIHKHFYIIPVLGSESDESDTDLDLKLLQRLQRIEGRETAHTEQEQPVGYFNCLFLSVAEPES